jgi:hypothetical protein
VAERCGGFQALTAPCPVAQPGHFGGRCRFIDEDKSMRLLTHARLPV